MKLDQIAIYVHNTNQVDSIKMQLGLHNSEWIEDIVEGEVTVSLPDREKGKQSGKSVGRLLFNYDLGIELELLTYLDGPHWHIRNKNFKNGYPFISHLGFHLDDDESIDGNPFHGFSLVQEMMTKKHTNKYVNSRGRTYHYKIFSPDNDAISVFLPDLKLIKRIQSSDKNIANFKSSEKQEQAGERNYYKGKSGQTSMDIIEDFGLDYCLGNIMKYVLRAGKKGDKISDIEDMDKVKWFADRRQRQLGVEK